MIKKRIHKFPYFIINKKYHQLNGKRYFLELELDTDNSKFIIVILKNPSKATDKLSDHTVNRVSNFIYNNRLNYNVLSDIGKIIILNLTPFYEMYSSKLKNITDSIIEEKNLITIENYLQSHNPVIIAWGDHPKGFFEEYENLKKRVYDNLKRNKNEVFYVNSFSKQGNPKHGQGWGYEHKLIKYIEEKPVGNIG